MPYKPLQDKLPHPEKLIAAILSYKLKFDINFFEEIDNIVDIACEKNPLHDITGIVCFAENDQQKLCFQYLEGPSDKLDRLLINISEDRRIEKMILEGVSIINERAYPQFAMHLVSMHELQLAQSELNIEMSSFEFCVLCIKSHSRENFHEVKPKPKERESQDSLKVIVNLPLWLSCHNQGLLPVNQHWQAQLLYSRQRPGLCLLGHPGT